MITLITFDACIGMYMPRWTSIRMVGYFSEHSPNNPDNPDNPGNPNSPDSPYVQSCWGSHLYQLRIPRDSPDRLNSPDSPRKAIEVVVSLIQPDLRGRITLITLDNP